MKFIHLSDIRIGNSSESGMPWERDRLEELGGGLRRVMREAVDFRADLVILSGGLFSHVPVTAELEEVSALFSEYPGIEVVLIAGETDPARNSSPVRSFLWPSNVHYFTGSRVERLVIRGIRTEIFAASVGERDCPEPAAFAEAASVRYPDSQPVRIAVLRSADDAATAAAFTGADISYAAVGSPVHGGFRRISQRAACPGFFEPEDMGDSGSHGIITGEIPAATGIPESIAFRPMAAASYVPLLIRTSTETTGEELNTLVRREIEKRGPANIYRLKLTGTRDPETDFRLDSLKAEYRISSIIDETEPEYDFRELFRTHPQDMIGFYISRIAGGRQEMSAVEKKAMYYGLEALLGTAGGQRT